MRSPPEIATDLRALAERARRLPPPNHRNPEAFHLARSKLGADLEALARELAGGLGRRLRGDERPDRREPPGFR